MSDASTGQSVRGASHGPVAVATVTLALVTWPIAFNLGAYGEVFYDDVFRFVVAASAGLAIAFVASPYQGARRWWTRLAMATPAMWLALSVLLFDSTSEATSDPLFGSLALVVALVSIPTVLGLLIDLFVPELRTLDDTRVLLFVIGAVVVIAVLGLLVGANNDAFMLCSDFTVAGSSEPANCAAG